MVGLQTGRPVRDRRMTAPIVSRRQPRYVRFEEITFESLGYAQEQLHVDALAVEYFIDICPVTPELAGKPYH